MSGSWGLSMVACFFFFDLFVFVFVVFFSGPPLSEDSSPECSAAGTSEVFSGIVTSSLTSRTLWFCSKAGGKLAKQAQFWWPLQSPLNSPYHRVVLFKCPADARAHWLRCTRRIRRWSLGLRSKSSQSSLWLIAVLLHDGQTRWPNISVAKYSVVTPPASKDKTQLYVILLSCWYMPVSLSDTKQACYQSILHSPVLSLMGDRHHNQSKTHPYIAPRVPCMIDSMCTSNMARLTSPILSRKVCIISPHIWKVNHPPPKKLTTFTKPHYKYHWNNITIHSQFRRMLYFWQICEPGSGNSSSLLLAPEKIGEHVCRFVSQVPLIQWILTRSPSRQVLKYPARLDRVSVTSWDGRKISGKHGKQNWRITIFNRKVSQFI